MNVNDDNKFDSNSIYIIDDEIAPKVGYCINNNQEGYNAFHFRIKY